MNKVFCWITGGHRYADMNLESAYNPYTGQSLLVNRCVKCGKKIIATIDTKKIIERDMERFNKQHGEYLRGLMTLNSHFSHTRRKDGADNE